MLGTHLALTARVQLSNYARVLLQQDTDLGKAGLLVQRAQAIYTTAHGSHHPEVAECAATSTSFWTNPCALLGYTLPYPRTHRTHRVPNALLRAHTDRVLIGVWDPML